MPKRLRHRTPVPELYKRFVWPRISRAGADMIVKWFWFAIFLTLFKNSAPAVPKLLGNSCVVSASHAHAGEYGTTNHESFASPAALFRPDFAPLRGSTGADRLPERVGRQFGIAAAGRFGDPAFTVAIRSRRRKKRPGESVTWQSFQYADRRFGDRRTRGHESSDSGRPHSDQRDAERAV